MKDLALAYVHAHLRRLMNSNDRADFGSVSGQPQVQVNDFDSSVSRLGAIMLLIALTPRRIDHSQSFCACGWPHLFVAGTRSTIADTLSMMIYASFPLLRGLMTRRMNG